MGLRRINNGQFNFGQFNLIILCTKFKISKSLSILINYFLHCSHFSKIIHYSSTNNHFFTTNNYHHSHCNSLLDDSHLKNMNQAAPQILSYEIITYPDTCFLYSSDKQSIQNPIHKHAFGEIIEDFNMHNEYAMCIALSEEKKILKILPLQSSLGGGNTSKVQHCTISPCFLENF